MSFQIISAQPQHVPVILQLIRELALYEKAPDEVLTTEETLIKYGFSEQPLFVSWVAVENEQVLGAAICYIRYSTWKGPVLYLEDLIVTEAARGRGMGKALFETCVNHAKEKGYPRMIWQVLDWNTPAIEFYRRYNASFDAGWLNAFIDF